MYHTIVLAYDGSAFCAAALVQASRLARLCDAHLHLLSIAPVSGIAALAESVGPGDVWSIEHEDTRQRVLDTVRRLRQDGLNVSASVGAGDPAEEIAAYVRQTQADLLVVGHTHKGMMVRWLQGSVGQQLLEALPCSLLVVSAKTGADDAAQ